MDEMEQISVHYIKINLWQCFIHFTVLFNLACVNTVSYIY